MNPVVNGPSSGRIAWNQGLRFGIIIGVINGILLVIGSLAHVSFLSYIVYLVGIVGFVLAGVYAARLTGRVITGALAGLWAGLISGIIDAIVSIILLLTVASSAINQAVNQANSTNGTSVNSGTVAGFGVLGLILVIIFVTLIGFGLGAIGGLFGRGQYHGQTPVHQEAYYQGQGTADAVVQTPPANETYERTEINQEQDPTLPINNDPNLNNPV